MPKGLDLQTYVQTQHTYICLTTSKTNKVFSFLNTTIRIPAGSPKIQIEVPYYQGNVQLSE